MCAVLPCRWLALLHIDSLATCTRAQCGRRTRSLLPLELDTMKDVGTLGAASCSPVPTATKTADPGVAVRLARPGRA